ncbi:MAG: type II toxin-antitoxin system RelE/ParE family toxin [Solirubrobacteraceae bacterium]
MSWEVEFTAEFERWYRGLDQGTQDRIIAAVQVLRGQGPGLGRPLVDSVKGSPFPMKELRVGTIRILFAFDPRRVAVLLTGGDKQHKWQKWYRTAIPEAGRLYAKHLKTIRDRG